MRTALPAVPNIVGALTWMLQFFSKEKWEDCKFDLWCRTKDSPLLVCILESFGKQMWDDCKFDLWCRMKDWPTESLWVQPPQRVLPSLSDIGQREAQERLHYWGAFLLLSPALMALVCEGMRLMFRYAKIVTTCIAGTSRTLHHSEVLALHEAEVQDRGSHPFTGPATCLTMKVLFYHLTCAGIVGLATMNDWISSHGMGSFSWELWALWQQACLWNLFGQNLVRCVVLDAEGLKASTAKVVVLYTAPLLSELCDTMKDWIVTGFCFLEARERWGYVIGAAVVLADLASMKFGWIPRCRITENISVCPPMMFLLLLYSGMTAVFLIECFGILVLNAMYMNAKYIVFAFVVVPITAAFYAICTIFAFLLVFVQSVLCLAAWFTALILDLPLFCMSFFSTKLMQKYFRSEQGFLGASVCKFDWYTPAHWFNETKTALKSDPLGRTATEQPDSRLLGLPDWAGNAYMFLTDGGVLVVVSLYVLVYAYIQVMRHEDCARDLRKVYRGILELPLRPAKSTTEGCLAWAFREVENVFVDLLSSSRLMVAWTEDIPQGILSLVLLIRYTLPHKGKTVPGLCLAPISAGVSLIKGFLIPSAQTVMFQRQRREVDRALRDLVELDDKLASLAQLLHEESPSFVIERDRLEKLSLRFLEELSADVLTRFNVGERELFRPILDDRELWLRKGVPTATVSKVGAFLVSIYVLEAKSTAADFSNVGYSAAEVAQGYRHGGFSIQQCREVGLANTVQKCRDAGFSCQDCLEAGHSIKDCKEGGYTCREFRASGILTTIDSCLDAGFSFEDVGRAFTVKEFKQDERPARDCWEAGFELAECRAAGYSNRQLELGGFAGQIPNTSDVDNIFNFGSFRRR